MVKKSFIFILSVFLLIPQIKADKLDDAVRASNFEQVNYMLILKGNAVSQHRKDELVLLANEMTMRRKWGKFPCGTLQDAWSAAQGAIATYIAYKCACRMLTVRLPEDGDELETIWAFVQWAVLGEIGLISGGIGLYYLIQGLRSAHGRDLYNQAVQIEQRIHELKVAESQVKYS